MQKKPPFIKIATVALLALLTVLIGLLSGIAPNELPPVATPYLRFTWPLLGIVTLAFISVTIWQTVQQSASEHDDTVPKSEHRQQLIEKQNRQRMLAKVHAFWIAGVLEQSLHGVALIMLGMHEQPDAVANPWNLVLQESNQPERPLSPDIHITEVYDKMGGELLILGEPGSGKTTLLLELAQDLLERAKQDHTHFIPVVLSLASWIIKQQPIDKWLIEELHSKYQVPRACSRSWVDQDQILPLLDGLDEVEEKYRKKCVEAINAFKNRHGLVPIVVCSRKAEYLYVTEKEKTYLIVRSAVVIQPLTLKQADHYVSSAGPRLSALLTALQLDPILQELAVTPLMLSVLALAYHGMPNESVLTTKYSVTQRKQEVFETYVQRMLQRRGVEKRYTSKQTIYWLTILAKQLDYQRQTEFYAERTLPIWKFGANDLWADDLYDRSKHGCSYGLIYGLVLGIVGGVLCGLYAGATNGLIGGIVLGLAAWVVGLIGGLSGGLKEYENPYYKYSYGGGVGYIIFRIFLWRKGYMPWNYKPFLDYATERILLRKIGNRYIFIHKLLLEYFASLAEQI